MYFFVNIPSDDYRYVYKIFVCKMIAYFLCILVYGDWGFNVNKDKGGGGGTGDLM